MTLMKPRTKKLCMQWAANLLLLFMIVLVVFPIFWMVICSIKTNAELTNTLTQTIFPAKPAWSNYREMWTNIHFAPYLRNSLIICSLTTVFAVLVTLLAAYALGRYSFPGSGVFGIAILATQMIPGIMMLIPIYLMFIWVQRTTGVTLINTYPGMIFVYTAFFVPWSVWIMRSFFATIPKELEDAALIDGCSPFQAMWRVILPLVTPGVIATAAFVFLTAWDELLFAWVLTTNSDVQTIPVGLRLYVGNYQNRYDLVMAASTVVTVPVIIAFFAFQRYIVSGLTAGAVKG